MERCCFACQRNPNVAATQAVAAQARPLSGLLRWNQRLPLPYRTYPSDILALSRRYATSPHASIRYSQELAEAGIEPFVSSIGNSYDNAFTEVIIILYTAELIHRCLRTTLEVDDLTTPEWVKRFKHNRLLTPHELVGPAVAEENYYQRQAALSIAE